MFGEGEVQPHGLTLPQVSAMADSRPVALVGTDIHARYVKQCVYAVRGESPGVALVPNLSRAAASLSTRRASHSHANSARLLASVGATPSLTFSVSCY